ncbi:MAG TPA: PilW family protein [Gammaproteobacteria bacterium]|nr:PilW family protein [Gammaproteobacteria bacterium]
MLTTRSIRRQRGVTLVELMVALVLGLLITGGVLQVFAANRASYEFNDGLSRLQENGRFALDTLNFRTRMAGYLGCVSDIPMSNNLNGGVGSLAFDFSEGMRGFEASGTGPGQTIAPTTSDPANSTAGTDWSPNLAANLIGSVLPTSDVLVIRNVSAATHALVSPYNDSAQIFVDATSDDYFEGEIGIVSDCQKASVFQMTNIDEGVAAGRINIAHAASMTPGNQSPTPWGSDQQYGPGAELMRGETWIYYVGSPPGGGPPALMQQRLQRTSASVVALVAEELVSSVETMQVLYGIDAALDGAVDQYVTADAVADWNQVVTVRISLVMRSPEEYGTETDDRTYDVNGTIFDPFDDRRERHVFTTTVAVRNRLP